MAYIPELVKLQNYRKLRKQTWLGSLLLPGNNTGLARIFNPSNMGFSKTKSYTIAYNAWFETQDSRVHTLVRLGTNSKDGYRIVKSINAGRNTINFQELKSFSTTSWIIPANIDITKPHSYVVTWRGNSTSSVTMLLYIDGIEIRTRASSINWSLAVGTDSPSVFTIGTENNTENAYCNINDVVYSEEFSYPDDIFLIKNRRKYKKAKHLWKLDENGGTRAIDSIGQNHLTLSGLAKFRFENQSYPPIPGGSLNPDNLTLVDSNMGINYGNHVLPGVGYYNEEEINQDLDFLWRIGIRKIRISLSTYTYPSGVDNTKALALAAKNKGFYIAWGVSHNKNSDANWPSYISALLDAAAWAEQNNIDELMIANEVDAEYTMENGNPNSLTDPVGKLKALATQVKIVYSGIVSCSIAQGRYESSWMQDKGDIDLLGYNCYGSSGSYSSFVQRITDLFNVYGNDGMYVSEWNLHFNFSSFPQPESTQTTQIGQRLAFLKGLGVNHFFFTYRWDNASDQFALLKANGQYRTWYQALFKPI